MCCIFWKLTSVPYSKLFESWREYELFRFQWKKLCATWKAWGTLCKRLSFRVPTPNNIIPNAFFALQKRDSLKKQRRIHSSILFCNSFFFIQGFLASLRTSFDLLWCHPGIWLHCEKCPFYWGIKAVSVGVYCLEDMGLQYNYSMEKEKKCDLLYSALEFFRV